MSLDRDGSILDTDKGMWQQCRFSGLLATLYNTIERREEWLALAKHGIDFIRRRGSLSSRIKGNMWKGPFHLPRMQWYCWRLLEKMKSGARAP